MMLQYVIVLVLLVAACTPASIETDECIINFGDFDCHVESFDETGLVIQLTNQGDQDIELVDVVVVDITKAHFTVVSSGAQGTIPAGQALSLGFGVSPQSTEQLHASFNIQYTHVGNIDANANGRLFITPS